MGVSGWDGYDIIQSDLPGFLQGRVLRDGPRLARRLLDGGGAGWNETSCPPCVISGVVFGVLWGGVVVGGRARGRGEAVGWLGDRLFSMDDNVRRI